MWWVEEDFVELIICIIWIVIFEWWLVGMIKIVFVLWSDGRDVVGFCYWVWRKCGICVGEEVE